MSKTTNKNRQPKNITIKTRAFKLQDIIIKQLPYSSKQSPKRTIHYETNYQGYRKTKPCIMRTRPEHSN